MNQVTKLYNFSFMVKRIQFNPNAKTSGKLAINLNFLRFRGQQVFEPVARPPTDILDLNAGKSFTFGLDRSAVSELIKEFIIHVNLYQTGPEKHLSEARVNVTRHFRDVLKNVCPRNPKSQVRHLDFVINIFN